MLKLNLKPTHKAVREYYATLQQYHSHNIIHEGAVSNPFALLLDFCAKKANATFVSQYRMRTPAGNRIVIDGAILDEYGFPIAYWEAKDMDDDLPKEVEKKRQAGYPFDNILFQTPQRVLLYQNGQKVLDLDISDPARLIAALQPLFSYVPPALDNWHTAVADFRVHVPALASQLKELIEQRHEIDPAFKKAFADFHETCRTSINPELSQEAVEEMLIQHLLTERIFRTVFDNSAFTRRNIIAREIENVVDALIRQAFSREVFLRPLDRFYLSLEQAAMLCKDFSQKQHFLNTFYEKFFQGFSEDVADTHGIVYTPQPIVDFMVKSVEHLLKTEFDRSLSDAGVHIIDPFVGTGNFIVRLMQDIQGMRLEEKYRHELHCNEVMLLPYYIANLNIENVKRTSDFYNTQVLKWKGLPATARNVDAFVAYDDTNIKWSSGLKQKLARGQLAEFAESKLRVSLFRPFTKMHLYFDRTLTHRMSVFPITFPTPDTETENRVICVNSPGTNTPFHTLIVDLIPDLHFTGTSQCFPFYTYDEDGTNRRENITDWALTEFRTHSSDDTISKWDIFHYTYTLLHHPDYREKYQANLKRDLPHIPFAENFWGFAEAGAQLAALHVNYESYPKYDKLKSIETAGVPIDWHVEKMKLSKDKTQLKYNDFLTLEGIPSEVYAYRLGTRSALEWIVDQYRVKRDKRSGIVNDPNRAGAPGYIVDLIGHVIHVSLKTVEIVEGLPAL